MSTLISLLVLGAALTHALWNSLLKKQGEPILNTMALSCSWIIIALIGIPFLPLPHPDSYWIIALSSVIHIGYFTALSTTYSHGDFGRVYPIIRGLPPLLVGICSALILSESLSLNGWLGVAAICVGILLLELGHRLPSQKLFLLAVFTAITVASYTVIDGLGARISGNSTSYLLWLCLIQSIIFVFLVLYLKGKSACIHHLKNHWRTGLITGILSLSGYGVILWAMRHSPIAYVSALRETSVLFAGLIAVIFLKEPFKRHRVISTLIILIGIILIKLA